MNSPASGLRLVLKAGFVGSIRPGAVAQLRARAGPSTTALAVVGVAARPIDELEIRESVRKRKPTRMLPPGSPPSWSSTGSIWRNS